MSTIPLTPEQRAQKWGTVAKIAALGLLGFLISPFILSAIGGVLGLLALGVIYGITWAVLPALSAGAVNLRLKLIKAEAAKNPIETLESEYLRRQLLLSERKTKIETLDAKTRGFGSKLTLFKQKYPAEAATYQSIYDKMALLVKRSREQWKQAEQGLDLFAGEIEKAKAKWEMALSASALQQDSAGIEKEFLAKLRVETSLTAIEDGMNMSFAQIDTLLMESDKIEINVTGSAPQAALSAPSSTAIDAEVLTAAPAAKSKVSR